MDDPEWTLDAHPRLQTVLPNLNVYGGGGCTDHRHIRAIGEACLKPEMSGVV